MTRREFLALLGTGAAGAGAGTAIAGDTARAETRAENRAVATAPAGSPAATTDPWADVPARKSLVVEVRSQRVVAGQTVHRPRLAEMIGLALRHVTGKENDADAWHALLKDDDVIGLKFNRSGASDLGTSDLFARLLVASLGRAGWGPDKIVLIETGLHLVRQLKVLPRTEGWRSEVTHFGSGADRLAAVLDQVTAIVNVPFLKANRIAGMSGCLKNLSHALVKHPAHYHGNAKPDPKRGILKPGSRCAPYIGDIVASPPIRDKLRLHLVNALRTYRKPTFVPGGSPIEAYGAILAGRDPVAIDMTGLEILNQLRSSNNLPPLAGRDEPLPQLRAAAKAGLGIWQPNYINHRRVRA